MELELVLHPDDAGKLLRLPTIHEAKNGRVRTQASRIVWHDGPHQELAADRLALSEQCGRWQLTRLAPGPDEVWPPGMPAPILSEVEDLAALPHSVPDLLAAIAVFEGKMTVISINIENEPVSLLLLRGMLRTLAAECPISRVRIEGTEGCVRSVALSLAAELRASIPGASLAAEALATAGGARPAPRRLGASGLVGECRVSVASAFRHVLGHLTDVILHFAPVAANGMQSTEPVHQMRVAVRRARSAIMVFRSALACPAFDAVNVHLKTLGAHLAPARDWDVFVTETAPTVVAALPQDGKLDQLVAATQRRRRDAHVVLQAWLNSSEFRMLGVELAWLAGAEGWPASVGMAEQAMLTIPLADFAAAVLQRRWKKVLAAGRKIDTLGITELHGLRLRAKRVRYVAEIFSSLYPGKTTNRFLARLNVLQRRLGNLNDAAVAEQLLREMGGTSSRHGYAIGVVIGFSAASAENIRPGVLHAWTKFQRLSPFWA